MGFFSATDGTGSYYQDWGSGELVFHADFRAELSRLDVPTLIVHGTGDASAPIYITGRRTAALMPTAQYKEYDNAAHGLT
jgi:non-heme chloroperoxidase